MSQYDLIISILQNNQLPIDFPMDRDYINKIMNLQKLYTQIQIMYNNDPIKLNQFINSSFTYIAHNKIFSDFYLQLAQLINIRNMIISQYVPAIPHIVSKYDYYFNGLIAKVVDINMDLKEQYLFTHKSHFVIISNGSNQLMIWNTQTHQIKYFTLPPNNPNFKQGIVSYDQGKFAIIRTNMANNFQPTSSDIILLNFETERQEYYKFTQSFIFFDHKMVNETTLWIATTIGIKVFNVQSLEEEEDIPIFARSLLVDKDTVIFGSQNLIMWREKKIDLNLQKGSILRMEFLDDEKLIVHTSYEILLIRNKSIIDRFNIQTLGSSWINDFIITPERNIIVSSPNNILFFDSDLNFKFSVVLNVHFMSLLPSGIMVISQNFIYILNRETLEIISQISQDSEKRPYNVVVNGRLYKLIDNQIIVYE